MTRSMDIKLSVLRPYPTSTNYAGFPSMDLGVLSSKEEFSHFFFYKSIELVIGLWIVSAFDIFTVRFETHKLKLQAWTKTVIHTTETTRKNKHREKSILNFKRLKYYITPPAFEKRR